MTAQRLIDRPHVITQCLENNYLVQMRHNKRITRLHANSLRKFHADVPSDKTVSAVVYEYCDDDERKCEGRTSFQQA